jgi:hypothetical protein
MCGSVKWIVGDILVYFAVSRSNLSNNAGWRLQTLGIRPKIVIAERAPYCSLVPAPI